MKGTVSRKTEWKAGAGAAADRRWVRTAPKRAAPNAPPMLLKKFNAPVATPRSRWSAAFWPAGRATWMNRPRPAPPRTSGGAETLRERKKRMTRQAIFDAATRMFSERGFDNVTVAEIADAANISVKTLFTYVRAKEDLVFEDGPNLLDDLVAAVRDRAPGTTPEQAVVGALLRALHDEADLTGVEGFHRLTDSPAVQARLRRMWDETEDALTAALAGGDDDLRVRAGHRLTAARLIALVRTLTSQEIRLLVADASPTPEGRRRALERWLRHATGPADAGR
jgi:AcrR family transcriptional regulator